MINPNKLKALQMYQPLVERGIFTMDEYLNYVVEVMNCNMEGK